MKKLLIALVVAVVLSLGLASAALADPPDIKRVVDVPVFGNEPAEAGIGTAQDNFAPLNIVESP